MQIMPQEKIDINKERSYKGNQTKILELKSIKGTKWLYSLSLQNTVKVTKISGMISLNLKKSAFIATNIKIKKAN